MRRLSTVALALLGLAVSAGCTVAPRPVALDVVRPASSAPAPAYRGPLVDLRGTPERIGLEHGRDLEPAIRVLHDRYLDIYVGAGPRRFLALTAARLFEKYFRPDHLAEADALARQTGIDERETVLAQCFLDLSPMSACSTITLPASASPDGVARFGRNLDFMSLDVADKYSTVFVYHPAGKYQFASIGWPGMIGVLSGMNEYGLALANMEVARTPRLPGAMPYPLLYRSVLERCRTVGEAVRLIERTPRQTANNLMLMDATGDRAVLEITPTSVVVRRAPPAEPLISTNHQRGTDCDTPGRCWRYDRLHRSGERELGRIGVGELESLLASVSPGKATLQSMIFEPANRIIYLSTGADAARKTFYRLDLNPCFDERR